METDRIKVLAIDDNQDNLISVQALIREAFPGVTVLTALNGVRGLELAAAEDPDVILLDIVMPGIDGFEVCRKLKADEKLCDIPVIFVTALKGDRESRLRALDCGGEAFLAKPIDEIELTVQIRAMVKIKAANVEKRTENERLTALVREQTHDLEQENEARKISEEAMRRSEERHRAILRTAMDGIWLMDMAGRLLEVNDSYCRMSGYSEQELLGMTVSDLDVDETADDTAAHIKKIMDHGSDRFETRHRHKDGSVFAVELAVQYQPHDSGGQMVAFIQDITERKKISGLQEFLALSSTAMTGTSFFQELAIYLARVFGMFYVCIDRLEGDGLNATTLAVWCDGVFEDNVTYALKDTPCGDVVGKNICCFSERVSQLFPLDQVLQDLRAESYIGVTLWSHSAQPIGLIALIGRTPLKNRPLVEAMLKLVAVRAAAELERLDAEAALLASEQKFRGMVDTLPLAIHLTTGIEQTTCYINPTMVRLFGYTEADIPSVEQWWPLAYPDENYRREISEEWNRRVERAIETQTPIDPMEVVVTCKDGSKKNISWAYITLGDKNYACGLDLTELMQIDRELQKKNAEIEQFIYTVSHDLRSPLVTVKTFMGYLEKDMAEGNSEQLAQDVQYIHGAADKMKLLLDELLEMSRIDRIASPPVTVTLKELVDEVLGTLAGSIKERAVVIQPPAADLTLFGDRQRLHQLLQNLVENAIKFCPDDRTPRIELGLRQEDSETVFFVRDNGIGIDPQFHSKVFNIFEKLNPKIPGAGLGLSMIERIVEKNDGRIWVESEGKGHGACFYFTLPGAVKGEMSEDCGRRGEGFR
ncbi:MAG: PAS domain S-box protein [Geobacteraceae bacterium]|nr:PAS domain S-box protein [Geobacteraceae bacterium]